MRYNTLGNTNIDVSLLCLGTMTWGEQNTEQEAFEQMDYAVEQGINFFDTAELYAVPSLPKTYGATERIIGNWLQARGNRDKMVIASKVVGPSSGWIKHIRGGKTRLTRDYIRQAIEGSLERLQTDYIDLYQLHWPDRKTNFFGQLGYSYEPDPDSTPIEETLIALGELVQEGKIRTIGLSNETAWGAMKFIHYAEQLNLPRMVTIQNPYNLLNRSFEVALAEVCHREDMGLMSYSPLGFGVLTGKYLNDQFPDNARCTLFQEYKRYFKPSAVEATQKYVDLAAEAGITPAQLALAFINQQSFLRGNIIGATTMAQLKENISSHEITLTTDTLEAIEKIHAVHTYPAP